MLHIGEKKKRGTHWGTSSPGGASGSCYNKSAKLTTLFNPAPPPRGRFLFAFSLCFPRVFLRPPSSPPCHIFFLWRLKPIFDSVERIFFAIYLKAPLGKSIDFGGFLRYDKKSFALRSRKSTFTATTAPSEPFGLWHLNSCNVILTYYATLR